VSPAPPPPGGRTSGSHPPEDEPVEVVRSEEELTVRRRERRYGGARVRTRVVTERAEEAVPLMADALRVVEVAVPDPEADSGQVEETEEGLSVPVFEERLIVQKRLVVAKRVLLRREQRLLREERVGAELRRQRVQVEIDRHPDDVRSDARRLAGEDLSKGPTPETRHPEGARDDVRDTTQGPTPAIRQVMRMTDDDPGAALEPGADRSTRGDIGGDQDLLASPDVERHDVLPDPDSQLVEVHEAERPTRPPTRDADTE